jgi:hypothetical protein
MNRNDPKGHSNAKTEQTVAQHGKTQGVTTNPENVGAGGGSSPAGHGNQDSRTWGAHDNQANAPQHRPREDRSKDADLGTADTRAGNPEPLKEARHKR